MAATKVYGYESGKASATFETRPEIGLSSYRMIQRAQAVARNAQWTRWISPVPLPHPVARVAPIAAGDKVVASTRSTVWRLLKQSYGDALAVEMEGYGFLQAVHGNAHVEALVVRGISDLIEGKSDADAAGSQEKAARNASAFAYEILATLSLDDLGRSSQSDRRASYAPDEPTEGPKSSRAHDAHSSTSNTTNSFQNFGAVHGTIQGGNNNTVHNFFTNAPAQDEIVEGKASLQRGRSALMAGNYSDAKRYLEAANLRLHEDQFPEENAQIKYLQTLAILQGKRPFNAPVPVWKRIEELMQNAITLHAIYSYLYASSLFKSDFARNGLRRLHYEARELMERAKETPLIPIDDDNINLLQKCQPNLMRG